MADILLKPIFEPDTNPPDKIQADPPVEKTNLTDEQKKHLEQQAIQHEPHLGNSYTEQASGPAQPTEPVQTPPPAKKATSYSDYMNQLFQPVTPPDHEKEIQAEKRKQSIANLTNAFRTLGEAVYGTKGYLIPQHKTNPVFAHSQAEIDRLNRLSDSEQLWAQQQNLTQKARLASLYRAQKADEERIANYERQYRLNLERLKQAGISQQEANDLRKENIKLQKQIREETKRHNIEMEKISKQNADTHEYNSKHRVGKTPAIIIDDNGEKISYSRPQAEEVYAKILDILKKQDVSSLPTYVGDIIKGYASPKWDDKQAIIRKYHYLLSPDELDRIRGMFKDWNPDTIQGDVLKESVMGNQPKSEETDAFGNPVKKKPRILP
jgi:thioredoxin-related protein